MTIATDGSASRSSLRSTVLDRALGTERIYFELGARLEDLPGAVLAWTPDFIQSPAASVVHRLEPELVAGHGLDWLAETERKLTEFGIGLARIYLTTRHAAMEGQLTKAGYTCREEIVFVGNLPDPAPLLTFRPIAAEEDWAKKRAFHRDVPESPDGHGNSAAELARLERHKCAYGMEAFVGEIGRTAVGVASAIWGDGIVRIKNLLIHPARRRQSVATALVSHIAALGRARGVNAQCVVALKGGAGEMLYTSLGLVAAGSWFEWSKGLVKG